MQRRRLGAGVGDADLHQQILRVGLGVCDVDDPVPVLVEHAGVQQLVLRMGLVATAVLGHQVGIRELGLRVVVAPPQPGVAGDCVQEPPVLLDILAMVALWTRQTEHPLLEDRVAAVPQRERHAETLADVAHARHAVLTPAVGARSSMVVRKVVPGRPVGAVVLAHRAPCSFREVGAPVVPGRRVVQAVLRVFERLHPCAFRPRHTDSALVLGRSGRRRDARRWRFRMARQAERRDQPRGSDDGEHGEGEGVGAFRRDGEPSDQDGAGDRCAQ